jgi:hypothetical protein
MKLCSFFGICSTALTLACIYGFQDHFDIDVTEPGGVCQVHNVPLQIGVVPINYGLVRPTKEEVDAYQKLFPHARSEYQRGCVVEKEKRARVSFCPECRKAEAVWKENHDQITARVSSHLKQVRELIRNDPRFGAVDASLYLEYNNSVGLEGSVKTEADLNDLRRLVEAMNPPKPVHWKVRVSPDEP